MKQHKAMTGFRRDGRIFEIFSGDESITIEVKKKDADALYQYLVEEMHDALTEGREARFAFTDGDADETTH